MQSYYETKKKHRDTIASLAKEALENHVLSPEQENGPVRMWLCHRPGTGMYHYRIVAAPGMLLVYGDVGDHMLQNHDRDLVKWLVDGAINSPDYLIQKMTHHNKHRDFFHDEAMLLLDRAVTGASDEDEADAASELRSKVLDNWDQEYGHPHDFAKAYYEAGGDPEMIDSTMDFSSGVYWTIECLKRFVELYNEHYK